MIVTTIDKLTDYREIPYAQDIIDFVEAFKKGGMEPGRYDIHGDDLFAAVSRYTSEPEADRRFENHRKYIDLQIALRGAEEIHWAPVETLELCEESFSSGGDIAFYSGKAKGCALLEGNVCAVLFENDAHMPNVMHEKAEEILKIVFKIKANS